MTADRETRLHSEKEQRRVFTVTETWTLYKDDFCGSTRRHGTETTVYSETYVDNGRLHTARPAIGLHACTAPAISSRYS